MENKKQGKGIHSILVKLLAMVLLPVIVIAVTTVTFSSQNMKTGMQEQVMDALRGTAYSFMEIYDAMDPGEYEKTAEGVLTKGNVEIRK